MEKHTLIVMLRAFICQRPGFDPRNYGDVASYRADYRRALRDRDDALDLLRYVDLRDGITANDITAQLRSGRLTLPPAGRLDYCTGQYFALEYRAAACNVLASVIWAWLRDECGYNTGDAIRAAARRELGARLARRWFN
jgi:hypothetical protein